MPQPWRPPSMPHCEGNCPPLLPSPPTPSQGSKVHLPEIRLICFTAGKCVLLGRQTYALQLWKQAALALTFSRAWYVFIVSALCWCLTDGPGPTPRGLPSLGGRGKKGKVWGGKVENVWKLFLYQKLNSSRSFPAVGCNVCGWEDCVLIKACGLIHVWVGVFNLITYRKWSRIPFHGLWGIKKTLYKTHRFFL